MRDPAFTVMSFVAAVVGSVLRGNVAARRTRRAEEHEYEADQAEHASEE